MSFFSSENKRFGGKPYELYWFSVAGQSWHLTSGDKTRTYLGDTYTPLAIARDELDMNQEAKSGSLKLTLPRTHPIVALFMAYLPAAPVSLVIYAGHDDDTDAETLVAWRGKISQARFIEACELTGVSEQYLLSQRIPIIQFQPQCPWILYGPGCGLDKAAFAVTGTVSALSTDGMTATITGFNVKPNAWLNAGWIEYGSQRRFILSHVGNVVTLIAGAAGLTVGASVVAYAGCMRNKTDCNTKFNNYVNFMGFEHLPERNPFDSLSGF